MAIEDLVWPLIGGTLVLLGLALAIVVIGFLALLLLPFAIGYAISIILWWLYDKIHNHFYPPMEKPVYSKPYRDLDRFPIEPDEKGKTEEAEPEQEEEAEEDEPETTPDDDWEEPEKEYELSGNLHISSELTEKQKGKLYTLGYNVLKISPFGKSGSAFYWVKTRHNESKEHAFFCYILEIELRKYADDVRLNATNGPDLVVKWKGKEFCFDVETGKSLSRQPDWLESKFAYYQREYDRSFILVTKRTLKYKYSHYGDVITRGKIKETLRQLFRRR